MRVGGDGIARRRRHSLLLLGLVAGCASALRARPGAAAMTRLTEGEKQRRKEGALTVLRDAGANDFHTVKDLEAHIGRELDITPSAAMKLLGAVVKALPPGHALRQKFDAIKELSRSSSARSAAASLGATSSNGKSLVEARQERAAYIAARSRLPTTQATAERLGAQLKIATKATAAAAYSAGTAVASRAGSSYSPELTRRPMRNGARLPTRVRHEKTPVMRPWALAGAAAWSEAIVGPNQHSATRYSKKRAPRESSRVGALSVPSPAEASLDPYQAGEARAIQGR